MSQWPIYLLGVTAGALSGYALGIAQTRRYHRQIFDDLMKRFEAQLLQHLVEKREWLDSLKRS